MRWMLYPKRLLPLFFCFAASRLLSQNALPALPVKTVLLSLAEQVNYQKQVALPTDCFANSFATASDGLNRAEEYNRTGHWSCANEMLDLLQAKGILLTPKEQLRYWLLKADCLNSLQQYEAAKASAQLANTQAAALNDLTAKTKALLLLSYGGLRMRNISQAYQWADTALQLARQTGDRKQQGQALLQTAYCARRHFTTQARRAFGYYRRAMDEAKAAGDSTTLFNAAIYLGADYFELAQWDEGLPYLQQGVALALRSSDVRTMYTACVCLAYALGETGLRNEALSLYQKALALAEQKDWPYSLQNTYSFIAGIYQQQKRYDSALLYANLTASVGGVDSFYTDSWELKAGIYKDMGDYKNAADFYTKAMEWAREDFLYRNQNQLSGYEAALDTKEKELQVAEEKKRSGRLQWLSSGAAALLILSCVGFAVQRRTQKKLALQNALIQTQRNKLVTSLAEKEILLKEIHHRVKNNLMVISSLLELQADSIANEEAKEAIVEGQNRIRSIALIHEQLYRQNDLASIDFGAFATDLAKDVLCVLNKPGQRISTEIQVPETLLDIDTAVPLGLILNELLTNSFKHAFTAGKAGRISISLSSPSPGHFSLLYADDGIGLPTDFDLKKSTSLGLRLIFRLAKQLSGEAQYKQTEGSTFLIHFKDSVTRNKDA